MFFSKAKQTKNVCQLYCIIVFCLLLCVCMWMCIFYLYPHINNPHTAHCYPEFYPELSNPQLSRAVSYYKIIIKCSFTFNLHWESKLWFPLQNSAQMPAVTIQRYIKISRKSRPSYLHCHLYLGQKKTERRQSVEHAQPHHSSESHFSSPQVNSGKQRPLWNTKRYKN